MQARFQDNLKSTIKMTLDHKMNRKTYIIIFNKGGLLDNFDFTKFHDRLTTATGLISWWHYIDNAYIIVTEYNITATKVSDFVGRHLPQKQFLVSELNLNNHNGWLPQEAWDWIDKYKS